jgi:hypothetical protein
MYVRKKPNRSGTTSVVIVDKSESKFRYLKTIGICSDEKTILELYQQGKQWIAVRCGGLTTLYFETDYTDDLRRRGFSKDGKHAQPQVVLDFW